MSRAPDYHPGFQPPSMYAQQPIGMPYPADTAAQHQWQQWQQPQQPMPEAPQSAPQWQQQQPMPVFSQAQLPPAQQPGFDMQQQQQQGALVPAQSAAMPQQFIPPQIQQPLPQARSAAPTQGYSSVQVPPDFDYAKSTPRVSNQLTADESRYSLRVEVTTLPLPAECRSPYPCRASSRCRSPPTCP